uniref:CRAL-TRIO domain-containing protein n=1 Tax=Pseudictyota dubia TaxID=2749911 RepID=A0A7R9Z558_9STRA|mmetsp:Transcript_23322/g.43178  ORF Transcript_23322/g.43178 Transcript_23322/m.43178 type:complete len:134 (+) Transcript_23322:1-402(+)
MERAVERKSVRKNGVVVLLDYRNVTRSLSDKIGPVRQLVRALFTDYLPLKLRAMHIILGSTPMWKAVLASFFSTFTVLFKKRVVIHAGNADEYIPTLEEKFGIFRDQLPCEFGGEYNIDAWKVWIRGQLETMD